MSAKQTVKQIVKIAALVVLVGLIYVETTSAYLSETVITTGNKIVSGCWDKPHAPDLLSPENNYTANISSVTFDWDTSSSTCQTATLTYKISIYLDEKLTNEYYSSSFSDKTEHQKELANGEYWWTVSVKDQYANTSTASARSIAVDQSQIVKNNWITTGDVQFQDDNSIQIGKEEYISDTGNYLWENRLMQKIEQGAKTLLFEYKFATLDDAYSDNPGFKVFVNGDTILSINASGGNIDWTAYSWDLSVYNKAKSINIEFQAGNTGDKINQSWVNLKNISTSIKSTTPATQDEPTETTYEEGTGYQNIIINELLWAGSDKSIELKNTTDKDISLKDMKFTKFNGSSEEDMNINPSETILAGGYLVIETDELDKDNLQIRIYNKNKDLVDVAGDGGPAFAGLERDGKYYSMERTIIVGEGTSPLNWFTSQSQNTLGEENY